MPLDLAGWIEEFIADRAHRAGVHSPHRRPLVGFAAAGDPSWARLRDVADPSHLLPGDLLPGARTVAAFFLPFAESVVRANRQASETAAEWALAYQETNRVINGIVEELSHALVRWGVRAAAQPATHNWDEKTLVSRWSHKSAAAIAGLGDFGLHRLLITDLGCAGRCGSLVLDAEVAPTPRSARERCRYFLDGGCGYCVEACPAGALTKMPPGGMNLDKGRCYARLLDVEARLGSDCCGKCSVGPCALRPAAAGNGTPQPPFEIAL